MDPLRPDSAAKYPRPAYGPVAKILHWFTVLLIATMVLIGWTMPHIREGVPQDGLVAWHMALGSLTLIVVVVRIAWRLLHPVPLDGALAPWERITAKFTHEALYALLVIVPLLGWAAASYFGYRAGILGILALPPIADGTMQWAHEAGDLHAALVFVLLGVIALHVLGGLWHHFVRRDGTLDRMLPATLSRTSS